MQRRALLTSVGAGAIATVGGCIVDTGSSDDPDGTETPTDEPGTGSLDIADQPCPPVDVDRDGAVCSHTVDPDSARVYLEADPERCGVANGLPVERIDLTLHNDSGEELTFNPHSWRIWHTDGAGWTELDPEIRGDGHVTVEPGGEKSWTFLLAVEAVREEPDLESGLYAAEIGVPDPGSPGDWLACVALVRLEANE